MKEKFIPAFDFHFLTKLFDLFISTVIPENRIKGELIDFMNIREGHKILDFGCGTGTLLLMGKQKHPEAHFEGIDIDPKILKIAEGKIQKENLDIPLTEYDGGELPRENSSINKVMNSLMMHHLSTDKKLTAMREIFRALVVGGEIYIADFGKQENLVISLIDKIVNKSEQQVVVNFNGSIPQLLADAGFRNVQTLKKYNTRSGTICIYSGE
ncbi:MAG: class I SAM-dependent methyltransferase [Ignavibacteriaceae bacterium]